QLVELHLRLRRGEPVVAQLLDRSSGIGRQRLQRLLAQAGVVGGVERERAPFDLQDLLQALPDLLQRAFQVQTLLLPAAGGAEAGPQRVQAGEAAPETLAEQ